MDEVEVEPSAARLARRPAGPPAEPTHGPSARRLDGPKGRCVSGPIWLPHVNPRDNSGAPITVARVRGRDDGNGGNGRNDRDGRAGRFGRGPPAQSS